MLALVNWGGTFDSATGGTFQSDTDGTFHSDIPGTFESDMGGTFKVLQSSISQAKKPLSGIDPRTPFKKAANSFECRVPFATSS